MKYGINFDKRSDNKSNDNKSNDNKSNDNKSNRYPVRVSVHNVLELCEAESGAPCGAEDTVGARQTYP